MGRAKLRMELISNKKARMKTFEKRKKGLEKAAHELSTLCGVDVGMIVYGPVGPAQDTAPKEPMIWPRNHEIVSRLIDSYTSISDHDSRYRTYNLSAFFKDKTEKVEEELQKLRKKTREVKFPNWDERYNCLSYDQLKEFVSVLMAKINAVRGRINLIKGSRIPASELGVLKNPSVQESAVFMPDLVQFQQQQPLVYYEPQVYTFDENCGNYYDYSCERNWVQNCGFRMDNVGARKDEQLISYNVPSLVQMPRHEEGPLLSSGFPQMQVTWEEVNVQRHGF